MIRGELLAPSRRVHLRNPIEINRNFDGRKGWVVLRVQNMFRCLLQRNYDTRHVSGLSCRRKGTKARESKTKCSETTKQTRPGKQK